MALYLDLTQPISDEMPVYPGDVPVSLQQVATLQKDGHSNFVLSTGMHAGTHVDGPMHLTSSLTRIDELPVGMFAGPGFLVNAIGLNVIDLPENTLDHLSPGSVVLFYTGYDQFYEQETYYLTYPVLSENTALLLVKKKAKMIGMDFPSPDYAPFKIHDILLNNHILIIENLTNLASLLPYNEFELLAFPLKIKADSSPVRVVARIS